MSLEDRRRRSRQAKLGLSAVAGGVGAGIGASKLRDAYREDYPEKFANRVHRAQGFAERHRGAEDAARVAHVLEHGKPHFRTLIVASGAGTLAAGADYYHDHLTHEARVRQRKEDATGVRKDAFGVDRRDLVDKSLTSTVTSAARAAGAGGRAARKAGQGYGKFVRHVAANPSGPVARFTEKHPASAGAGALFGPALAQAHTRAVVRAVGARRGAKAMSDAERAGRLAHDLAPHRTPEMPTGVRDLFRGAKQQRRVHADAVAANKDTKRVRGAAERYSRTYTNARRTREAAEARHGVPSRTATVLRPRRSTTRSDAHALGSLTDAGRHVQAPTLYRSMHGASGHKVGDHVDFGRMSSWTSDPKIAGRTGEAISRATKGPIRRRLSGMSHVPKDASQRTYRREGGGGANISGATRTFRQNEWLAGGKHEITSTPTEGAPYYGVRPVNKRATVSPFGIDHGAGSVFA